MIKCCRIYGTSIGNLQRPLTRWRRCFATISTPVELKYTKYSPDSPPTRPPVLFLHGLFGSKINFSNPARKLSKELALEAYTLDCRNHGASPHSDTMSYEDLAGDVRSFMEGLGMQQANIVGHSMGGKAACLLALTSPELLHKACIVDISPTVYAPDKLEAICEAMSLLNLDLLRTRAEAFEQLDDAIPDPSERNFILSNLVQYRKDRWKWRINLDVIQDHCDDVRGWPEGSSPTPVPTLFLYSETSGYLNTERIAESRALFPSSSFHPVPGAGHIIQLDQPELFYQHIHHFFQ